MTYDQDSFLSGVAVGRALRGWATMYRARGGADPIGVTGLTRVPPRPCDLGAVAYAGALRGVIAPTAFALSRVARTALPIPPVPPEHGCGMAVAAISIQRKET